jgi:hypothetical protein
MVQLPFNPILPNVDRIKFDTKSSRQFQNTLKKRWKKLELKLIHNIQKYSKIQLRIVPTELIQKAPLPIPQMRILTDVEHHKAGDGLDIEEGGEVQMGQPLRVEFSLQPETGLTILLLLIGMLIFSV